MPNILTVRCMHTQLLSPAVYFVSTVLQFQIYRAVCERTGQFIRGDPSRPLHKCDIYRNPEAGRILKRIMERGSSAPWTQILQETIGEGSLNGEALRDYFRPLEDWLRSENLRTGEYLGWSYDGDYCKFSIETAGLQVYGGFYNAASRHFDITSFFTILLVSVLTTILAMRWRVASRKFQDRRREIFENAREKKKRKMGSAKFKNCDEQDFVQKNEFEGSFVTLQCSKKYCT
ncbi:unnamed protein product [Arctia plantaginis]|uniref:Uncharacterized protein n=1 Tax=Arctia plantaginis TaxID=874455 RepID=A0A8S1A425_ARCPL|nr:unnamed protein product [Arctia plantaginis]